VNHKFLMGAGGGFVGAIVNQAQEAQFVASPVVNAGYATAGTDTGHQGSALEAGWALNDLERQVNFGYLAVHRTIDVARRFSAATAAAAQTRRRALCAGKRGDP
jgi:feruloyl esterase